MLYCGSEGCAVECVDNDSRVAACSANCLTEEAIERTYARTYPYGKDVSISYEIFDLVYQTFLSKTHGSKSSNLPILFLQGI